MNTMKKLIAFCVLFCTVIPALAQAGVADPGVYVAVASGPIPVEQWLMNEGSGNIYHTSSGSGDNITSGGALWVSATGFPGLVPSFSVDNSTGTGANQTNTNFTGATPFSISVWVLIASFGGSGNEGTLVSTLQGGGFTGWEAGFNNETGGFGLQLVNNSGSSQLAVESTSVPSTGVIHHLCATYDGSQEASGVTIYLDGVAQSVTIQLNSLSSSIANTQPVVVGVRPNGSNFYDGVMTDLRIYNIQLTSAQVGAIFAAGPA